MIDDEVAQLHPRRVVAVGGLVGADAESGGTDFNGRAGHVGPCQAVAAGTGEEQVAAALELQDGVEVVALGVGELLTAHTAEDGQHIAAAVEQIIDKLYPDAKQGVITVTDEKKGERIVLITSADSASLSELHKYFKKQNVSELWMPKEVVYMKTPPLLGSGKFDYLKAKAMYDEQHQV